MAKALPWVLALVVAAILIIVLRPEGPEGPSGGSSASAPLVGNDLHSLVIDPADPDTIYVGSHEGVSVSTDGGASWHGIESLAGADAMGWAFTGDAILVGGHPGIAVSTDGGETFEQQNDGLPATDVHALGSGEDVIYAGIAGTGLFASTDGGQTWEARSQEFGGAFMGRIQVDPDDEDHLVAPDMTSGAVESTDGGRTWEVLGGLQGAMWVSWAPDDADRIIVTGQGSAASSVDGGKSWEGLNVPEGVSIVEFSPHNGEVLYAAALDAPEATVYVSRDGGETWDRP